MNNMQGKTGQMVNAYWVAIHTIRPTKEVKQLLEDRKLSQKQMSDFWKTFRMVRDYLN